MMFQSFEITYAKNFSWKSKWYIALCVSCATIAQHGMLTTPLALDNPKSRNFWSLAMSCPTYVATIFGYALVFSWACVKSESRNTPLTVMRNHYTKKGNLGNGHECPS